MHSELRAQIAFRLTGLRAEGPSQKPPEARSLRPALAARLRDLAALRYDFPIVLLDEPAGGEFALPLTTIVDRMLDKVATPDADGLALRQAVLRLEHEVRRSLAQGASGSLASLWKLAAQRVCARAGEANAPLLEKARAALAMNGELADCDAGFAPRFMLHAWKAAQRRKAAAFRAESERLILGLGEILKADEARSPTAHAAGRLRQAFGTTDREEFDFESMSRLLAQAATQRTLGESRRARVRSLVVALESQRFFLDPSGYTFVFQRCAPALRAFRARYARLRSLARTLALARLELEGEYDEARHDPLFRQLLERDLTPEELAAFPDYLVCLREGDLTGADRADLLELACSGVPAKILVQSDDLLEEPAGSGLAAIGARVHALAGMAIGLNEVFVLQTAASNLPRMATDVERAFAHRGAALLSVFSGASGDSTSLPPYLNAAAAMESRVFPAFTFDPAKGAEEGPRFSLANNPQPGSDWTAHAFEYEDAALQRTRRELRLTPADFVAADERFARHFLCEQGEGGKSAPVADWLEADAGRREDLSPVVLMVDPADKLRSLVVDEPILQQVRRCRDRWNHLQRLAAAAPAAVATIAAEAVAAPAAEAPALVMPAAPASPAAETPKAASSDDPYIETPRCTTCNECTQINDKMFAYDANKQAFIADAGAGTYRQLVEAAESCQVSIIHPGKPRNTGEPGLEDLLARAEAFR